MRAEIPRDLGAMSTTTPCQVTALLMRFSESQIVRNTPIAFAEFDPTVTAQKCLA
jgi:hypothetical protein